MMVDPWECVDLTSTCDSDGESSALPGGEPGVDASMLPDVDELHGSPAVVSSILAQTFDKGNSEKFSKNQNTYGLGDRANQHRSPPFTRTQGSLRIESFFSITSSDHDSSVFERTKTMTDFDPRCPDFEEKGKQPLDCTTYGARFNQCEVIEINDDSDDPDDTPSCDGESSVDGDSYSTSQEPEIERSRNMGIHHWEEVSHNRRFSELNPKSAEMTLHEIPLKPHITLEAAKAISPGCLRVDVNKTDSVISIDDEDVNEECLLHCRRKFNCMYCEYSAVVEEGYHKHIASHLPGTKPYIRMYCTECSYSTGSQKFLFFHMAKTHSIDNPEFYRSGENQYTCISCKINKELRSDIEAHINSSHKKEIFQCAENECAETHESLSSLSSHIMEKHKITPSFYCILAPRRNNGKPYVAYGCFSCSFSDPNKLKVRSHAKTGHKNGEVVEPVTGTVCDEQNEGVDVEDNQEERQLVPYAAPPEYRVTSPGRDVAPPDPHFTTAEHQSKPGIKSPGRHARSPEPDVTSPGHAASQENSSCLSSPELQIVTPPPHPASPEPEFYDDEQLVDMPEYDQASPLPPYINGEERRNETDTSDSESDADNPRSDAPRSFYCIYCEYSTVIEEWYHKHIASHLPGTKPYFRMYCTECSYSTGSEKFLLYHMSVTHNIINPEFYRSGEKRYTCRMCKHTQELRLDIETHIRVKHKTEKRIVARGGKKGEEMKFFCGEDGCENYFENLKSLRTHVRKRHNIRFPLYYRALSQKTGQSKVVCFSCSKPLGEPKIGKFRHGHAKVHFTRAQINAPYLYKCPLPLASAKCTFSCKKKAKISEHYQAIHSRDVKFYKKHEYEYGCLNCSTMMPCLSRMENHCNSCKKI